MVVCFVDRYVINFMKIEVLFDFWYFNDGYGKFFFEGGGERG